MSARLRGREENPLTVGQDGYNLREMYDACLDKGTRKR